MSRVSILQLDRRNDGFYENLQSLLDRSHEQVEGVGKHVSAFAASKQISVVRDSTDSADRKSKLDVSLEPRTGIAPVNSRED